jgi:TrmH family RNA methyltransferase
MPFDIKSPMNDRIKWLIRLRERRHRDRDCVFLVEGERLYGRALQAGLVPVATFVADPGIETTGETITVDPSVLDRVSYRSRSEGLVAVFPMLDTQLSGIEAGEDPMILILENIEKPGNLGAMARTASVAGASALIAVGSVDVHNPNAVRASTGAVFDIPIAVTGWEALTPWLAAKGVEVIVASVQGHQPLWETDLTGPVAIVIGAEDRGHSEEAEQRSDRLVAIPQADGNVDSLNASVAAAVLLFEAVRQRSGR